jgi:hypothetical protein
MWWTKTPIWQCFILLEYDPWTHFLNLWNCVQFQHVEVTNLRLRRNVHWLCHELQHTRHSLWHSFFIFCNNVGIFRTFHVTAVPVHIPSNVKCCFIRGDRVLQAVLSLSTFSNARQAHLPVEVAAGTLNFVYSMDLGILSSQLTLLISLGSEQKPALWLLLYVVMLTDDGSSRHFLFFTLPVAFSYFAHHKMLSWEWRTSP